MRFLIVIYSIRNFFQGMVLNNLIFHVILQRLNFIDIKIALFSTKIGVNESYPLQPHHSGVYLRVLSVMDMQSILRDKV
jgi:hypothetical protein